MAAAEPLSAPSLSSKDTAVLQALFDPESSPSAVAQIDSSLPQLPRMASYDLSWLQKLERDAIRPVEALDEEISCAAIERVISELSVIIESQPLYAPAYVNRAQALRMLIDNYPATNLSPPSPATRLFSDLAQAISLATPSSETAPVSALQVQTLANAHTHRAYLLYKAAQDQATQNLNHHLPEELHNCSSQQLEELASRDFRLGGRYGCPLAKQMAVKTNPYAKMCGAIVGKALTEDIEAWRRGSVS